MNNFKLSALLAVGLLSSVAEASVVHFASDFENAVDSGASITDNGYQLTTIFGDPSLVGGELLFNLGGAGTYEQTKLSILNAGSNKVFHIEFDMLTENLANSGYGFGVFFDTPTVQTLNFNNCCSSTISAHNPNAVFPLIGSMGSLIDNQSMHVDIDIDLISEMWTIGISGIGTSTGGFYSENGSIESMRMSLSPAHGSVTAPDSSINVYIDNLHVVSAVPLPASIWLFSAGLLGLVGMVKRK
jgi:hypothetical protein